MSGARRDWLSDVEGTSRRLAASTGLGHDAALFGDICVNCDARWALSADRATCPHLALCEDCWPTGCEACEWQVHETEKHREHNTNQIVAAVSMVVVSVDDLSDSDLRSLGFIRRHDMLRAAVDGIEALRRVRDVLRDQEQRNLAE